MFAIGQKLRPTVPYLLAGWVQCSDGRWNAAVGRNRKQTRTSLGEQNHTVRAPSAARRRTRSFGRADDLRRPAATSTFLSFPCAKNAREVPSGDQNGAQAPPVPARLRAVMESSARTHKSAFPAESCATNARFRESGRARRPMRASCCPGGTR